MINRAWDFLTNAILLVCREVEPMREGKEPREFWDAIGGFEEYATGKSVEVNTWSQSKQKLNHLVPRTSFFDLVFGTSLNLSQDFSLSGQFSDFVFPSERETELPATFIPVFQCFRSFSSGRNLWLFTRGKGGEYRQNLAMFHYFW